MHPKLTVLLLAAAALGGPATTAADAGAATPKPCPAKKGTLAKNGIGRVWHQGTSLYGCTTIYGKKPATKRLGPWKPGTKVAWDGSTALWSVPLTRDGVVSDRMWAASAQDGRRWLTGTRLVPKSGEQPAREARVQKLVLRDEGAAWVTKDGAAVFALHSPESEPEAIGTPPAPLQATDELLLIGEFAGVPAADLAASMALTEEDGEGDECGGSNPYRFTVTPGPDAAPVGAAWQGGWSRPDCG